MKATWDKAPNSVRKAGRRDSADVRQAEHDSMPGFDKIAKILERPGNSAREKLRILAGS